MWFWSSFLPFSTHSFCFLFPLSSLLISIINTIFHLLHWIFSASIEIEESYFIFSTLVFMVDDEKFPSDIKMPPKLSSGSSGFTSWYWKEILDRWKKSGYEDCMAMVKIEPRIIAHVQLSKRQKLAFIYIFEIHKICWYKIHRSMNSWWTFRVFNS